MMRWILLTAAIGVWAAGAASAQPIIRPVAPRPAPATGPAPSTAPLAAPPRYTSVELDGEGRITFRLYAPQAKRVGVFVEWRGYGSHPMRRSEEGIWEARFGAPPPGDYLYWFGLDGLEIADPRNPSVLWSPHSWLNVGGADSPSALRNVPHGVVHGQWYASKLFGTQTRMSVYTPPSYEDDPLRRYPVLFLLHGAGDTDEGWIAIGRTNLILDNLIADGTIPPLIVVMPYGGPDGARFSPERMNRYIPPEQVAPSELHSPDFQELFSQEILPAVDQSYRISTDPRQRAIAGFGDGGCDAVAMAMDRPQDFAYAASFGGDLDRCAQKLGAMRQPQILNDHLRLLWLGCGRHDPSYKSSRAFADQLDSLGVKNAWTVWPGQNDWVVWRRSVARLLPLLFHE